MQHIALAVRNCKEIKNCLFAYYAKLVRKNDAIQYWLADTLILYEEGIFLPHRSYFLQL